MPDKSQDAGAAAAGPVEPHLIVVTPFGAYAIGDRISDAAEIEQHADSPHVVRAAPPSNAAPHQEG